MYRKISKKALKNEVFYDFIRGTESALIGVHFPFVPALVFDQRRVVFSVVRVLFFEDRMHPAAVFFVSVSVVYLDFAFLVKTLAQLGNRIGNSNIYIKCIDVVLDGFAALRQAKRIAFDVVRGSHKDPEIFGKLLLRRHADVYINAFLDKAFIEIGPWLKPADIHIGDKQIIVDARKGHSKRSKVFLHKSAGARRLELPDFVAIGCGIKVADAHILIGISSSDPVTQKFIVDCCLQRDIQRISLESDFCCIRTYQETSGLSSGGVIGDCVNPVGKPDRRCRAGLKNLGLFALELINGKPGEVVTKIRIAIPGTQSKPEILEDRADIFFPFDIKMVQRKSELFVLRQRANRGSQEHQEQQRWYFFERLQRVRLL